MPWSMRPSACWQSPEFAPSEVSTRLLLRCQRLARPGHMAEACPCAGDFSFPSPPMILPDASALPRRHFLLRQQRHLARPGDHHLLRPRCAPGRRRTPARRSRSGSSGCGGRGSGAANQALSAYDKNSKLVAIAGCAGHADREGADQFEGAIHQDRVDVSPEHRFTGLDGFQKLLALRYRRGHPRHASGLSPLASRKPPWKRVSTSFTEKPMARWIAAGYHVAMEAVREGTARRS